MSMSNNFFSGRTSLPIGAQTGAGAMSGSAPISAGQIVPAALAAKNGQAGRFVARPNPNDNYSEVIHDLRDFRDGVAMTRQMLVERLVTEAPEFMIRKIYPTQRTDTLEVEMSVWEFNHGQLPQVPEQGTYRVLSSRMRKKRGRMVRRGIALDTETTSLMTSGGMEQQQRMLQGLAIAVIESAIQDVAWEITDEGEKHLSNATAYAGRGNTNGVSNPLQQARAEREIAFSVHKNPQRFALLVNNFMRELSAIRGVTGPYALIVPADFRVNIDPANRMLGEFEGYSLGNELMRSTFSNDGPVLTFPNGVEVYQLSELHIYDRPAAGDIRADLFQMLSRQRVFAEYYQMAMGARRGDNLYDGVTETDQKKRFRSRQRDIILYDVQKDMNVRISFLAGLILALGGNGNGNGDAPRVDPSVLIKFKEDDFAPSRGARGAPFFLRWESGAASVVKYLFQIAPECIDVEDIRQRAQSKLARLNDSTGNNGAALFKTLSDIIGDGRDDDTQQRLLAKLSESNPRSALSAGDALARIFTDSVQFEKIGAGFKNIGAGKNASGAAPNVTVPFGESEAVRSDFNRFIGALAPLNASSEGPTGLHVIADGNVALVTSNDVAAAMRLGPVARVMACTPLPIAAALRNVEGVAMHAGAEGAEAIHAWARNVENVAKEDDSVKQQFALALIDGTNIGANIDAEGVKTVVAEVKRNAAINKKSDVKKVTDAFKNDSRLGAASMTDPAVRGEFRAAHAFIGKQFGLPEAAIDEVAAHVNRSLAIAKRASSALPAEQVSFAVLPGTIGAVRGNPVELSPEDIRYGINMAHNSPAVGREIGAAFDELNTTMARASSSRTERMRAAEAPEATAEATIGRQFVSLSEAKRIIAEGGQIIDPNTGDAFEGRPEDLRASNDMVGHIGERMTAAAFFNMVRPYLKASSSKMTVEKQQPIGNDFLFGIASIGASREQVLRQIPVSAEASSVSGDSFENHYNAIIENESNPVLRKMMILTLFDLITDDQNTFQPLLDDVKNNVHVPVNVLLFAPFMTYVMDTFCLLKYGSETGVFFYGFPAMMQGNDVSNQTTTTTFSIWMRAFTMNGKNIINIPNSRCKAVVNGCGTEFFSRSGFVDELRDRGDDFTRKSLIAVACAITENVFPEFMSPAGFFTFGDHNTQSIGKYHFSSAKYEHVAPNGWKLNERIYDSTSWQPDAPFGANPSMPEVAMQGQVVFHTGEAFDGIHYNNAHRGKNSCFRGAAKALNGIDTYFIKDKDVTDVVLRDIRAEIGVN